MNKQPQYRAIYLYQDNPLALLVRVAHGSGQLQICLTVCLTICALFSLHFMYICEQRVFIFHLEYIRSITLKKWHSIEGLDAPSICKCNVKCQCKCRDGKKRQTLQTRLCYFSQMVLFLSPECGKLCVKSALFTVLSAPELSAPVLSA